MGTVTVSNHRRVECRNAIAFAHYIAFEFIPPWAWIVLTAAWLVSIVVAVIAAVAS
jgi:hypothetical protein